MQINLNKYLSYANVSGGRCVEIEPYYLLVHSFNQSDQL